MEIKQALSKEEFIDCWEVVQEFRPLLPLDQFLTLVLQMLDESYKMIFIEKDGKAISICGYRYTTMLQRGRSIYIDDWYTLAAERGKGYGSTLLNHVLLEARENNLQSIHLDSGHSHFVAHRILLNKGFKITEHHLSIEFFY
ncbi:MAG: GNAT family N-acetyltransferase [Chitinophagaceae bacterium]